MTNRTLRLAYRARSHLVIWEVLRAAGIWEKVGLQPEFHHEPSAKRAEAKLFGGEIDFISGNHITPYQRRAEGIPMVYIAQPYKSADDVLISREPIRTLSELRGKVIADRPLLAPDGHVYHPRGDHLLYLDREGVGLDDVKWLEEEPHNENFIDAVAEGRADATFASPTSAPYAVKLGLRVLTLPPLPMILGPTIASYAPRLREDSELPQRLIRALSMGVRKFMDDPAGTVAVLERDVAPGLGIPLESLRELQTQIAGNLEPSLCPTMDQVNNAYRIACMTKSHNVSSLNPLMVWDLRYVQALQEG